MLQHHRDLSGWAAAPIALAPLLLSLTAFTDVDARLARPREGPPPSVFEMEARAAVMGRGMAMAEAYYDREIRPVEGVLRPYHPDLEWVRTVSFALVREGKKVGVDPRVLAAVVLVEDPWLDPDIRSTAGAIGLMQVMPFHAGHWECGSDDLTDPYVNVCHGARIFRDYLARAGGDLDQALLAYNGCVNGTNTSDCHLYPSHVYSRAGRVALRGWLDVQ
jgi:soluble lytic murein transglycosylase-like protein